MYLDLLIVAIIIIATIGGFRRGVFLEFLEIFGIVINFVLSKFFAPYAINILDLDKGDINFVYVYLIVFAIIYAFLGCLLHILVNIMRNQRKGIFTILFGGILGAFNGLLISLIILFAFNFISNKYTRLQKYGRSSYCNAIFMDMIPTIDRYIPNELRKTLTNVKNGNLIDKYLNKL